MKGCNLSRSVITIVIATTLSIPTVFALPASAPASTTADTGTDKDAIGLVIWTKGTVNAKNVAGVERPLARRSPVYKSDVITTGADGTGQIAFTDNSTYAIDKNTEFKISQYAYKKDGKPADDKSVMSLVKGGFRSITGNIAKTNPEGYEVVTPVATIGVRGTQFSAFVADQKGTFYKIDKGSISVKNAAGTINLGECATCVKFANVETTGMIPKALYVMPNVFAGEPPIAPATPTDMKALNKVTGGAVGAPLAATSKPATSKAATSKAATSKAGGANGRSAPVKTSNPGGFCIS